MSELEGVELRPVLLPALPMPPAVAEYLAERAELDAAAVAEHDPAEAEDGWELAAISSAELVAELARRGVVRLNLGYATDDDDGVTTNEMAERLGWALLDRTGAEGVYLGPLLEALTITEGPAVVARIRAYLAEASDDDGDNGCEGHPASEFQPMGETFYCDGTCRR